MFRFLRHYRSDALDDHQFGRYVRYALGEVLLVVIGILIALQIDNWNDDRIEQRQIREYAHNLRADLASDLEMLRPVYEQIEKDQLQSLESAAYIRGRDLDDFDNADIYLYTSGMGYRPYGWNRAAMDQLKSSGALRQMRNPDLVSLISAYDALTHHLDQDYANDNEMAQEISALADRIRDSNHAFREQEGAFDPIAEEGTTAAWKEFAQSDVFTMIKDEQLPLLTDDVRELRTLANRQLAYASAISARIEHEVPRLRELSVEIARLIEAEYP